MNSVHKTERDTCRLIITRRNASEVLLLPSGRSWSLLSVEILRGERIAEQLTAQLHAQCGFQAYCLFMSSTATSDRAPQNGRCAVMETLKQNDNAPAGTQWVPLAAVERWDEHTTDAALRESIRQLRTHQRKSSTGPFARPGWFRDLFQWAQEQIDPLGLRMTGYFRQLNASPTFSLIRLETTGPAVWFKATGEPNLHEFPVSVSLARLFPEYVPAILGTRPTWNAWLSREVSGQELDQLKEYSGWERVAEALANLQIASIAKRVELVESECKDLRLRKIIGLVDPFLARMADFMASQEKPSPAPLKKSELCLLGNRLKEACWQLQDLGFPDTLGHIDFSPGNILVSPERCCFLDWAEGCVTQPFFTFEYLREYTRQNFPQDGAVAERVTAAYIRPWRFFFSAHAITRAMAVSPLIAVFAYAVANKTWCSSEALNNPSIAACLRSLTRRMNREAKYVLEESERCLN